MLFYETIAKHADDRLAIIFKDETMTYGELKGSINRWAAFLQAKGLQKGEKVGLFSKNCTEFIIAYHAIIKAGGVVVPINFMLSAYETAYILKDAGIRFLFVKEALDLDAALANHKHDNLEQITFAQLAELPDAVPTPVEMDENDNCTIIYTSGTTGNPKGAMLSHKNLVANANSVVEIVSMVADERALCVLPMHHCFGWMVSVASPMLAGGCVVIQDNYTLSETIRMIQHYNVAQFAGIPTFIQMFLRGAEPEHLAGLRFIISGGAPLPQTLSKAFFAKFGVIPQEGYGLSEASPVCAVNPADNIKYGSIGLPIPGVEIQIHDEDENELPRGQIGELCVRGDNVMLGYYNLPEASAAALHNGWLRTGDLAYMDEEGYTFIVDRSKDMIILGGENVYPREVEEVIYTMPEVSEASVVGVADSLRGQAVCAFIVLKEGATGDKKEMRRYLMDRLALYKVPRHYFFCDALPKNSTGKILKTELRESAAALLHKV